MPLAPLRQLQMLSWLRGAIVKDEDEHWYFCHICGHEGVVKGEVADTIKCEKCETEIPVGLP